MTRWKIELRDIDRERCVGTILVNADKLAKAKQHAVRVYRRRLSGSGEVCLAAKSHCTYWVTVGNDKLGEVRITPLASTGNDTSFARYAARREPLIRRGAIGCSWRAPRRGAEPVPPPSFDA